MTEAVCCAARGSHRRLRVERGTTTTLCWNCEDIVTNAMHAILS